MSKLTIAPYFPFRRIKIVKQAVTAEVGAIPVLPKNELRLFCEQETDLVEGFFDAWRKIADKEGRREAFTFETRRSCLIPSWRRRRLARLFAQTPPSRAAAPS